MKKMARFVVACSGLGDELSALSKVPSLKPRVPQGFYSYCTRYSLIQERLARRQDIREDPGTSKFEGNDISTRRIVQ